MFSTSPPSVWNWQSRRRVQRDVLVVGVVLEDVLAVQGLAVAGDRVHAVEVDALADDRERVAGEVEVGHRVDDQVGTRTRVDQGVEGRGRREGHVYLGLGHAGHGLLDELRGCPRWSQLLERRSAACAGRGCRPAAMYWSVNSARAPGPGRTPQRRGSRDRGPPRPGPQDLGRCALLLLRDLQERDVVEQESLELRRAAG